MELSEAELEDLKKYAKSLGLERFQARFGPGDVVGAAMAEAKRQWDAGYRPDKRMPWYKFQVFRAAIVLIRAHDNQRRGVDCEIKDMEENHYLDSPNLLVNAITGPLTTVLRKERDDALQAALSNLDDKSRAILWDNCVLEKSFEEIAFSLGITRSEVQSIRKKAVNSLAVYLKEKPHGRK